MNYRYYWKRASFFITYGLALGGCASISSAPHRGLAGTEVPLFCNILSFGAVADGVTDNTKAIQAAITQCQNTGGTVFVPAGKFVSGTITLGSNMTLKIDPAGTIFGTSAVSAYPVLTPPTKNGQILNCKKALIYAAGVHDLTIDGGGTGTIDGNGTANNWNGDQIKEDQRPMAIFIVKSTGIHLQNMKVLNGATWAVVSMENQTVRINHFNVDTRLGVTHDGIDIVDGSDVILDDVTVSSGDDAICLKSGIASGLHGVTVSNSKILGSQIANGLKFGTASVGPLDGIVFDNISINHVSKAAMAIESVDGSKISDITFKNIQFHNTGSAFFVLLGWRGDQTDPHMGSVEGIHFSDITGDSMNQIWGSGFSGTELDSQTARIENITFDRVNVSFKGGLSVAPPQPPEYFGQYPDPNQLNPKEDGNLPASGLYFRHATGVSIAPNCQFTISKFGNNQSDVRPVIEHSQDAQGDF